MFFRTLLCILCFPALFLTASTSGQNAQYSKEPAPSWVKTYDFPLEPVLVKPSQVNFQYLLIDKQMHWGEKTLYRHFAAKVLTQSGVEDLSQLNIDFDPSYSHVIVHTIRIFRDGQWVDRLENARHNVIQREKELERNLYNGELTLVHFLDDIREGDIIDHSYSTVGYHPLFTSHYTDMVYLQRDSSAEKITHRLLGPPDFSFLIKPFNTSIETKIADLSPSLREWVWEATDTDAHPYEPNQPVWHNPPAHIQISQYETWEALVRKLSPLYTLPSDFTKSVPFEMQALAEKWKASTNDLSERALLALRFVQNEVRYLGIEEGMGAFQPRPPHLTFQKRFGDCKDKAFLLHALLHLMDIPSTPLLVHSSNGKRLSEALPDPTLFNHLVLQIEIQGTTYSVDPTYSLQGGSLQTNFFPNYEYGLLLREGSERLTPLPKVSLEKPTEIDTSFILESEDSALLKIKSVYHGFKADQVRRSFQWRGMKKFSEDCLTDIQEIYGAAILDSPLKLLDDRENNILTLTELYRLPTQKTSDTKMLKVLSFIIRNYLDSRVNPERSSPYAISYPLWMKEHIHIESPFIKWKPFEENYTQEHESLFYNLSTRIEEHRADFDIELKHLQDHVPQTSLRDYWTIVNDIDLNAPPRMNVALLPTAANDNVNLSFVYWIAGIFIWVLSYFVFRKNRPTQQLLIFHLGKFRMFFSVITILGTTSIFGETNLVQSILMACGLVVAANSLCSYIVLRKSTKAIWIIQGFLGFQACLFFYLIFMLPDLQFAEKILALATSYLYLGSCLFTLNQARSLIVKEKMAISEEN